MPIAVPVLSAVGIGAQTWSDVSVLPIDAYWSGRQCVMLAQTLSDA